MSGPVFGEGDRFGVMRSPVAGSTAGAKGEKVIETALRLWKQTIAAVLCRSKANAALRHCRIVEEDELSGRYVG